MTTPPRRCLSSCWPGILRRQARDLMPHRPLRWFLATLRHALYLPSIFTPLDAPRASFLMGHLPPRFERYAMSHANYSNMHHAWLFWRCSRLLGHIGFRLKFQKFWLDEGSRLFSLGFSLGAFDTAIADFTSALRLWLSRNCLTPDAVSSRLRRQPNASHA